MGRLRDVSDFQVRCRIAKYRQDIAEALDLEVKSRILYGDIRVIIPVKKIMLDKTG